MIDVGGILYGTTVTGGNSTACTSGGGQPETCGTVFSLDPASGVVATVYSFQGGSDGAHPSAGSFGDQLLNVGHTLYGTIVGSNDDEWTVFSLDLATGAESVVSAFEAPPYSVSNLIDVDGTLYGTVDGTGLHGNGGVFSVNPASGAETVVSVFRQRSHGFNPEGGLTKVRALLYGTTAFGGSNTCRYGCGTIFSLNPGTGVRTVLYEFQGGSDGFYPNSSLLDVGGTLYGVTGAGGSTSCSGGCGTVFALKP